MDNPSYHFSPHYLSGTSAWVAHLPFGYDLVRTLRPSVLVELGTWRGDSFFTFCQSVADHRLPTVCYAVDHWMGDVQAGKHLGDVQFAEVHSYASARYPSFAYLMRTDFMNASREFSDASIDLLHIDGFHSREAVTQDFATWLPKVREGGVILFHDIMVRSSDDHRDFGVWNFWDELKSKHRTWQFVHGYGLGIYVKGENTQVHEWLEAAASGQFSEYYARRGTDLSAIAAAKVVQQERAQLSDQNATLQSELDRLKREVGRLERKIEDAKEGTRSIKKAVQHWNGRSWFTRAFNRLDLKSAESSPAASPPNDKSEPANAGN